MRGDWERTKVLPSPQAGAAPPGDDLSIAVRICERQTEAPEGVADGRAGVERGKGLVTLLVLIAVEAISGIYAGLHIGKGWIPADDGTLAQSALRVLEGQLPHRDFTEIYTGGLSFIHALAFRAFGVNLMSLRVCVFLFFLAWLPAVYYVALRFSSTLAAGLVTLLAVAWSYPNYPAAMPSWYNLFCATYGAAALLRYLDTRRARWLFIAGLCGGLSLLIKVIGAYYIAGALLFLAFLEQGEHDSAQTGEGALYYRVFSVSALLAFLATVIYFFRARLGGGELYQFVLPAVTLVAAICFAEGRVRAASARARFTALLRLVTPFMAGVLAPIALFLIPYARSASVAALFTGVISSAVTRSTALGIIRPAGAEMSVYGLALLGLLSAAMFRRESESKIVTAAITSALALMLCLSANRLLSGVWLSVATLTPLVVLSGIAVVLSSDRHQAIARLQRQRVMLLICIAGLCSFVQYPFAAPIYLCYCLPLTLLAAVSVVATARRVRATYMLAAVMAFYLLFGMIRIVPGYIYELTHKVGTLTELKLDRAGGLRIESAAALEDLVHFLQQRSPNRLLYAGNDCPAFYFVSGLKNVTQDDAGASPLEVIRALQSSDVKVVLINQEPFFPGSEMSPEVRANVTRTFPGAVQVGIVHMGLYEVFWRQ